MFPLVQSHPPRVSTSDLNTVAHPRRALRIPENRELPQSVSSQHFFSFPIRTFQQHSSQLSSSTAIAGNSQAKEYQLRRKTPNGTIVNGYDGTPIKHSVGGPPFKQLAVSAHSASGASLPRHAAQNHSSSTAFNLEDSGGSGVTGGGAWGHDFVNPHMRFTNVSNTRCGTQFFEPANSLKCVSFSTTCQPVIRANEYNVRAFCPPPPSPVGGLPLAHFGWQIAAPVWPYQAPNCQAIIPTFRGHHKSFPPGVSSDFVATSGPSTSRAISDVFSPPYAQLNGQELQPLVNEVHGAYNLQPGFKEKALSQGYQCYADIIGYVQSKRNCSYKDASGMEASSSRHLIFPKPPRPRRESGAMSFVAGYCPIVHAQPDHSSPAVMVPNGDVPSLGQEYNFGHSQTSSSAYFLAGIDQFRAPHTPAGRSVTLTDNLCFPSASASPFNDSFASIELLRNLCEQSQWRWADGILVLGCLYYALEDYGNSLQCFSRSVQLDARHVEAVANKAAALYCLGRYAEAEQHWLRAIRMQPSYLEAAEQLVGVLYKKRSGEAIEIVSYVQRALMATAAMPGLVQKSHANGEAAGSAGAKTCHMSFSSPLRSAASRTNAVAAEIAGFDSRGSSGYFLPGSENGRILALVHAKGTMLYGLKDVEGAALAFEEAVLISVGRRIAGIRELVRLIQSSLARAVAASSRNVETDSSIMPLLLMPERARHTARLVFGGDGELPGLKLITDPVSRRAALQTTSNALLSLAKIFQDSMSGSGPSSAHTRPPSGVGDILALYYLSLSLQESPSTANNVGILLAGIPQAASPLIHRPDATLAQPTVPGVTPGNGTSLALAYYNYGLRLDPKHVHLHTNLGSLLKDIGQLDLAIQMYERAVVCDGTFDIALTNLANAIKDKGRINEAISYYRRAVIANPGFAEAVCGLFTALNSVCDWRGRGGIYLSSGTYDRWHVNDKGLIVDATTSCASSGLARRVVDIVCQQLEEAANWGRHVLDENLVGELSQQLQALCEDSSCDIATQLRCWIGSRWTGSRILRLIERASKVILRKWYIDLYGSNRTTGRTNSLYKRPQLPPSLSTPSAPTVLPFHTFTCPLTAREVRIISQRNAARISCSTLRSPWLRETLVQPPPPPDPQLKVGYLSSDFNNHPLAHLMQSVFGFHDTKRVEAFCYATTPSDKSSYRQKIENEAPIFRDVSSWPPERLVKQIHDDGIHILVNLNGYTRGARNEIFAARPAPVQVSFMGFAGTLGAEWCDYILADTTAIPPSTLRPYRQNRSLEDLFHDESENDNGEWIYPENIIFCRDTFFCCDHAQSSDMSERLMSWEDEELRRREMRKELFPNLPDDTVILANFNQLYKIEPSIFRSWLRILAQTPNAILWLLRFPESGESNLRRTAELWAGAEVANRIVFTDVAQKNQHISRARICDLFLDTPECNAHTTAADVLWSSTPLLTLPRYPYKMCSRMAASILRGALPRSDEGEQIASELIANTETEYEAFAIRLAAGLRQNTASGEQAASGRLVEIRRVLWSYKWTCGLFNTRRWVRDVEDAYEEAWARWVSGHGGDIYL